MEFVLVQESSREGAIRKVAAIDLVLIKLVLRLSCFFGRMECFVTWNFLGVDKITGIGINRSNGVARELGLFPLEDMTNAQMLIEVILVSEPQLALSTSYRSLAGVLVTGKG